LKTRKSNELQIGKAGEYLVCADLIIKGLIAFPSEQGLPYDVIIDNGEKLLKCQVKTTSKPRKVPQRVKERNAYIFNVKRHGKNNQNLYHENEVDIFALCCLDSKKIVYLKNEEMPKTLIFRDDNMKGQHHDEKGVKYYNKVIELRKTIKNQAEIARKLGIDKAIVNKMMKKDYKPFETNARYFSDMNRNIEWFKSF